MITRITGRLNSLSNHAAYIAAGAFEYEVYIPEFVRRQLQPLIGEEVTLRTIEYLEGNPQKGRLTPRLIGFMNDAEREFFDLVCSVDGVGVRTALRAMVRPVREVAAAIEEQDVKQLTTLPGIGAATAERVVAKLRRKMPKFALMVSRELPAIPSEEEQVLQEAFEALISLGHTSSDARKKLDRVTEGNRRYKSVEELLTEIYRQETR